MSAGNAGGASGGAGSSISSNSNYVNIEQIERMRRQQSSPLHASPVTGYERFQRSFSSNQKHTAPQQQQQMRPQLGLRSGIDTEDSLLPKDCQLPEQQLHVSMQNSHISETGHFV